MEKYHKIETLYEFDIKAGKFKYGTFYNKTVELLKDFQWVYTEKIDGMNLRLIWDGYKLSYMGRTDTSEFSKVQKAWIEANIATSMVEQAIEQMFKENAIIIFGEFHGNSINSGYGYSKEYQFKVFDVLVSISEKPITRKYVSRDIVQSIAADLGFDTVPVIFRGTIAEAVQYVKDTQKSTFSDATLEGLVGVPVGDMLDSNGERIIVKIKRRDIQEG